jgi:hypothetical protein
LGAEAEQNREDGHGVTHARGNSGDGARMQPSVEAISVVAADPALKAMATKTT